MAGISKRRGGSLPSTMRSKSSKDSSSGKHKIDKHSSSSLYHERGGGMNNVSSSKKSDKLKNNNNNLGGDGVGLNNESLSLGYNNNNHQNVRQHGANNSSSDKLRLHLRTPSSSALASASNDQQQQLNHHQSTKSHKSKHSNKSYQSRRVFDPQILSRGLSGRVLGSKIPELKPLQDDEINKDLRLMEAYHNACITYSQKFFIFQNQALVSQGYYDPSTNGYNMDPGSVSGSNKKLKSALLNNNSIGGPGGLHQTNKLTSSPSTVITTTPLPVRIDPEEEKRLAILRKKISYSESQREVLETQYLSLRASYVHQNQTLKHLQMTMDSQLNFVKGVVHSRAKYLALRRLRVGVARDILSCLECQSQSPKKETSSSSSQDDDHDDTKQSLDKLLSYWNNLENELKNAEKECMSVESPSRLVLETEDTITEDNSKYKIKDNDAKDSKKSTKNVKTKVENKKRKIDESSSSSSSLIWENQYIPKTPYDVLLYTSCLGYTPDKFIGSSLSSIFGSHPKSIQFVPTNLPPSGASNSNNNNDDEEVNCLLKEMSILENELKIEQNLNLKLHNDIETKHARSNEMCSFMSLLRNETESLLHRHNIILETPEAKNRAKILYLRATAEKEKAEAAAAIAAEKTVGANATAELAATTPLDTATVSTFRDGEEADNEQASSEEEDDDELEEDSMLNDTSQQEDETDSLLATKEDGTDDDDDDEDDGLSQEDDNAEENDSMVSPAQSRLSTGEEEVEEEYSVEEGEIHGEEEEEEGEIVEDDGENPIKEVIVRHSDSNKEQQSKQEEEDDDDNNDDEDEGEIHENDNGHNHNRLICEI